MCNKEIAAINLWILGTNTKLLDMTLKSVFAQIAWQCGHPAKGHSFYFSVSQLPILALIPAFPLFYQAGYYKLALSKKAGQTDLRLHDRYTLVCHDYDM